MIDPSTKVRTNLLRVKGAGVVGVYHPLIDEKLVRILHGYELHVMHLYLTYIIEVYNSYHACGIQQNK